MHSTVLIATALVLLGFANAAPASNAVTGESGAAKNTLQGRDGIPVLQEPLENASSELQKLRGGKSIGQSFPSNSPSGFKR